MSLLDKLRAVVGAAHVLTGVELSRYVIEGRTPEVAVLGYGAVDMARLNESIEQLGFGHGFKTKFRAEDIFDPAFLPRASERRVQ